MLVGSPHEGVWRERPGRGRINFRNVKSYYLAVQPSVSLSGSTHRRQSCKNS